MEPAILVRDITRRFGDTIAVDHLTLEVAGGEITGLLGHNGAGKTTTVRLLNGVLIPDEGEIRVLGLSPTKDGAALRRRTGVLTETPSLDERLTARENLLYYADLYGLPRSDMHRRVEATLRTFDLGDRADESVGGYSKGMKQRLALARALLHEPEIIFLDEPTAGLDPVAAHRVHDLINALSHKEGHTVFLCTHNLVEAQALCDRVAVMEHGRLVALGTPSELARNLWKGIHVEIEMAPEGVAAAQDAARTVPGVEQVDGSEKTLTASVVDREVIPVLLSALAGVNARIYRVSPLEPTLEDVYFALHERNGRGQ